MVQDRQPSQQIEAKLFTLALKSYNGGSFLGLTHLMKSKSPVIAKPVQTRIIRAVASSTAIETGQSVKEIEALLKARSSKFQQLNLAPSA